MCILIVILLYLLCHLKEHEKPTTPEKKSNPLDAKEEGFRRYLEREYLNKGQTMILTCIVLIFVFSPLIDILLLLVVYVLCLLYLLCPPVFWICILIVFAFLILD